MATFKQKKAIKLLTKNDQLSVSKAMLQSGYAPSTTTVQLTRSKAFQEYLLTIGIDDKSLGRHLKAGLHARTPGKHPDWTNRHKYFESAIKLSGYVDQEQGSNANITIINPLAVNVDAKGRADEQQ